jgi:hypothetical protein
MSPMAVPLEFLKEFEAGLNPRFPERSPIPARVLGYGEIGTTLEITGYEGVACKRFPMFYSEEEAIAYQALHDAYVHTLREAGLNVVPSETARLEHRGRWIVYIFQKKFPADSIGHQALHILAPEGVRRLVVQVVTELRKVFRFNRLHRGEREVGIDGQISNWAMAEFDPHSGPGPDIQLAYFDTSTPLMRIRGQEQLNPELFLRSAPSFLVWLIRWLFLPDVMTRYYDFRQVVMDLVANFYKEQCPDLIPLVLEVVNGPLVEGDFPPLTVEEVRRYYRQDAWIWRTYLAFRKVDRALHHLIRRPYPYILPEKIRR